jgi:hypothetical protein
MKSRALQFILGCLLPKKEHRKKNKEKDLIIYHKNEYVSIMI